jgi:hypothetical protein
VSFDAADALALARFWAAALGSDVDEDSTPDKAFVEAPGWGGPNLWFTRVPEPKTAKNRVHFDLRAPGSMEAEVARLARLGATVTARHPHLTVMADPEGNEFCVEPGPARITATGAKRSASWRTVGRHGVLLTVHQGQRAPGGGSSGRGQGPEVVGGAVVGPDQGAGDARLAGLAVLLDHNGS